jgi:hypothetical protein
MEPYRCHWQQLRKNRDSESNARISPSRSPARRRRPGSPQPPSPSSTGSGPTLFNLNLAARARTTPQASGKARDSDWAKDSSVALRLAVQVAGPLLPSVIV